MKESFQLVRSRPVEALNLTFEEYRHPTGAVHFHLANDYEENVFMVAFRTVPEDSTGVAHILEHTVLCGSDKFPVRDPFFSMIRRSLNTFMNAYTTSDYTAYPFASQNRKDYFNLMEVYLDAVFHSRLDPLDFAQEGHRIEFEVPDDPASPLVYKGVVFNEMKGDTSSPSSMLYHGIQEVLYPGTTYHYNSGGDPSVIPSLSYEALMAFYRTHYHPANAVFMTFGNISAAEQQEKIGEFALDRLSDSQQQSIEPVRVKHEQRLTEPVSKVISYPVDDEDTSGKTHIVLAWLLGENTDLETLLRCHLLSDMLLDTSASPLRHALETTELATGASPMCGFEEDHMETNFMCGVEGSEPEHADAIEQLVMDVLLRVAEEGVDKDRLEAVLHQLELSQREIGGDGVPYGLQLIFSCMSAAVHGGDPVGLLDLDPAIDKLRQEIEDPAFIRNLVRELLIDNPHRVRLVMQPDRELGAELLREEATRLEAVRSDLDESSRTAIIDRARQLMDRQQAEEDLEILPKVTRADIAPNKHFPAVTISELVPGGSAICKVEAGTNGLVYHQVVRQLPELDAGQLARLPLYSQLLTEVGSAGRDYLETQHVQHSVTGGISAFSSVRSDMDDCDSYRGFFTCSTRTLNRQSGEMAALLKETAGEPRFDEHDRIRELVQQLAMRRTNAIASNGHHFAMSAAAAPLRPVCALSDYLSGIPGIMRLKRLADDLSDREALQELSTELGDLHQALLANSVTLLLIDDHLGIAESEAQVTSLWQSAFTAEGQGSALQIPASMNQAESQDRAFVVTTQVNYCAAAWATVPEAHPDAAVLSVLAGVLRNNFLHAEIREKGGAYGGGAGHDGTNGVFRMYSYRDPAITGTFDVFLRAVDWVLNTDIPDSMIEEAVLGIISSIDAPGSPAGEIRQAFHHQLYGRSAAYREERRRRYLDVGASDLRAVAERYLTPMPGRALVTSENRLGEVDNDFDVVRVNQRL